MPTLSHGKKIKAINNPYGKNIALFGAFCLFLSAVEYMIPKPLPFMRIGLANLPIMLALDFFPLPAFLVLVCVKVFGQALITGTLFSYIFLFSITGTFLSALIMFFLRRIFCSGLFKHEHITFIGIGTAGAAVSSLSQLALAHVFIFRENVFYIAPVFLFSGLVTGIVLGVFCEVFTKRSEWYCNEKLSIKRPNTDKEREIGKEERGERKEDEAGKDIGVERAGKRLEVFESVFGAKALFMAGFLIMPALLFNPGTEYRIVQFFFFSFLVLLSGKKINLLLNVFIIIGIVAFNLIIPYGRVLFSVGAFKVTSGALTAGIHRAVTLCALVMLSKVTVRQDLKLPGSFGELLCKSLRIFSVLMTRKNRITAKNFICDMDRMMRELSEEDTEPPPVLVTRTKPVGYVILIAVIIISWLPWIMIF